MCTPSRLMHPIERSQVVRATASASRVRSVFLRVSEDAVIPIACCARATWSASSSFSPGMKRATDRRTMRDSVARSRSQPLVERASSARRASDMGKSVQAKVSGHKPPASASDLRACDSSRLEP